MNSKPFNVNNWKEFCISDLFQIEGCKCSNASELENGNDIEYIGAKKTENGHMKFVAMNKKLVTKGKCIVFICDGQGSVGYSIYMEKDFIGSTTLCVGYNENLNKYIGMFLVSVLDLERPKYSFGRKYKPHLRETTIILPSKDGQPDWEYMENYAKSVYDQHSLKFQTKIVKSKNNKLNIDDWKEFRVGDIFRKLDGAKYSSIPEGDGYTPVISCSSVEQGVTNFCDEQPQFKNAITVSTNGECFDSFYHDYEFVTTTDVETISCDKLNKYNALFICSILNLEKPKWGYGRKAKNNAVLNTIIKLPSKDGQPDWEYMENYIKNLPYGDKI